MSCEKLSEKIEKFHGVITLNKTDHIILYSRHYF